jgi:hypothetical protein
MYLRFRCFNVYFYFKVLNQFKADVVMFLNIFMTSYDSTGNFVPLMIMHYNMFKTSMDLFWSRLGVIRDPRIRRKKTGNLPDAAISRKMIKDDDREGGMVICICVGHFSGCAHARGCGRFCLVGVHLFRINLF